MEPFRRQLATGQTSVMDWDIINLSIYLCFRLQRLLFYDVVVFFSLGRLLSYFSRRDGVLVGQCVPLHVRRRRNGRMTWGMGRSASSIEQRDWGRAIGQKRWMAWKSTVPLRSFRYPQKKAQHRPSFYLFSLYKYNMSLHWVVNEYAQPKQWNGHRNSVDTCSRWTFLLDIESVKDFN